MEAILAADAEMAEALAKMAKEFELTQLTQQFASTTPLLVFVFVIAAFLGIELISKVPSQLHTPLMSGTNAISGITIVGAIATAAASVAADGTLGAVLGFVAIVLATINVVGGYFVTDRMLGMFRKKGAQKK